MPMDGKVLAQEALALVGGERTPERVKAFEHLCEAIVKHIQMNAQVLVAGVQPGAGTATGKVL